MTDHLQNKGGANWKVKQQCHFPFSKAPGALIRKNTVYICKLVVHTNLHKKIEKSTFERHAAMSRREKIDEVNGIQSHLRFCFLEKKFQILARILKSLLKKKCSQINPTTDGYQFFFSQKKLFERTQYSYFLNTYSSQVFFMQTMSVYQLQAEKPCRNNWIFVQIMPFLGV